MHEGTHLNDEYEEVGIAAAWPMYIKMLNTYEQLLLFLIFILLFLKPPFHL